MDNLTRSQRKKNMSSIKRSNNKSTEISFLTYLKKNKIKGWRRQPKKYFGSPDFIFPKIKLVIFLDGCFWHGCRMHFKMPLTIQNIGKKNKTE